VLASAPLIGAAREASLKILEMTAGQIPVLTETYLGLRHGPMSFLREDTLVLCFLSSSPRMRSYELDLLVELHAKKLGYVVAITPDELQGLPISQQIRAIAPELPDTLRTPFEIVFAQLLALHLSLQVGLNPDNPSPDGVINRVVQGVRIHDE
jgi:tagatose-6-phosphate ketose/aldose isomerase